MHYSRHQHYACLALLLLTTRLDLATDKAAHLGLSGLATAGLIKAYQATTPEHTTTWVERLSISAAVLAVGLAKEWDDQRRGRRFDLQDVVADGAGIIVGNLVQWEF